MKEVELIIGQLRKREFKPVYLFAGEEPYYTDVLCDLFEQDVLQEAEKDFNFKLFYGKDTDVQTLVNECRSYPVFATHRLVIVKEAAQLKDIKNLEPYLMQPLESTILVLAHKYKKADERTAWVKAVKKQGVYQQFDKIKDYKLSAWIQQYVHSIHIKISPANADLLALYLGNDLQKIVNEIAKVRLNIGDEQEIHAAHIERYIGISREYNVFSFPNAILNRDAEKSMRTVHYFITNPKETNLVAVLINLYREFTRLYQYHHLRHQSETELVTALKLRTTFALRDYQRAASLFSLPQTEKAILLIDRFNQRAVGIHTASNDMTLLKELTAQLLFI